jgi:hypothetical protein
MRHQFLLESMLCLTVLAMLFCSLMLKIQSVRDYIIVIFEMIKTQFINQIPLNKNRWDNDLLEMSSSWLYFVLIIVALLLFVSNNTKMINAISNKCKWLNPMIRKFTYVIFVLYFLVLYLNQFILGINLPVFSGGLDPSWILGLSRISGDHLFFWGKDITFTFGPYGYLFFGQHYIHSFLFGLIVLILNIFLFYINCFIKKTFTFDRLMLFSLVLFGFVSILNYEWIFNLTLFFFFCTFWKIKDNKILFYLFSVISGLFCSFSLLFKFNTGVLAFGLASIFSLYMLLLYKKDGLKYLFIFIGVYLLFLIFNIPYHFNSLNNFIIWLLMSMEIAKGYSEIMVTVGLKIYLLLALIIIALYFVIFYITIRTQKNNNILIFLLFGSVILFFSFKHGFVRQDAHIFSFFYSMPFLFGFLYLFLAVEFTRKIFLCFSVSSILSIIAMTIFFGPNIYDNNAIKNRYYDIVEFSQKIKTLDQRKTDALQASIISSEWNELIGDNTIQILPWELSYAIANNWQGWVPNPVLQLYSVYTKKLDEYSALSFSEERAPRYILLEYSAIDNRNMFMDTPETWNTIIHNYKVSKSDSSRLLLEKKSDYKKLNLIHFDSKTYKFGEEILIPISNNPIYAKISIKQTFFGKIRTTLFRGCPPDLKLEFQDGNESTYRVIADVLDNPVLLSAIPTNFSQMENFFNGTITDDYSVKGFTFFNKSSFMYKNTIKIDWYYNHIE